MVDGGALQRQRVGDVVDAGLGKAVCAEKLRGLFEKTFADEFLAGIVGRPARAAIGLARRLIGEERLASFAGLWERIGRNKAETLALNLDRKALVLETIGALAAAAEVR